jgi:type II secretory pathway component GspD/PulD (secretin)
MNMRHQSVALLSFAFAAIGSTAFAQDGAQPQQFLGTERRLQTMRINVDVEGVDLADVMEQIGQKVGRNILVDPNVQETVTVSLREIPWREAVDVIAKMTRCEVEPRPGDILLLTQPPKVTIQFTDANVRTVLQLLAAYSGKNIIISPLVTGDVTLDLKEVHWLRALHAIVKTVGDYEVVEETDDLLRVVTRSSIEQQLETVVFKLRFVRPPATYRAIPPASAGTGAGGGASGGSNQAQASVFIGNIQNVAAATVAETFTLFRALQAVVQNSGIANATLEFDEQTNSFLVTATKPLINQLKKIIAKVDIRPAQIYTEVKFVATRDNNNQNYGVEFSEGAADRGLRWSNQQHGPFPQRDLTFFPGANPVVNRNSNNLLGNDPRQFTPTFTSNLQNNLIEFTPTPIRAGELPFLIGEGGDLFNESLSIPSMLNLSEFSAVINLLDRDDRSRTIQSPSLFMMDNQDAVIFVGDQVPYAEFETSTDASGNAQASIREGARSPVAIGFSLFVQPHVIPDEDRIHMTVIPRVNDLVGTSSPGVPGFERFAFGFNNLQIDLPRTREQALVTHVMLDDTQTAVLGGLMTEVDSEIIKRVPFLSSLPILGNIFTNTVTNKRVENLTIFITPTIIRQRKTVDSIFLRATKRLEKADYFYQKYEKPALDSEEDAGDDDDDDDDDDE